MRYQHWWTPFSCCSRQFLTIHGRRRNDNFKLTAIDHHVKTCKFTKDFLLSLQSYSFFPTIDKPNRVYYNSATLIDNIFARTVSRSSGNIISDISDHYSQFCIDESCYEKFIPKKVIKRYFSWFSEDDFNTNYCGWTGNWSYQGNEMLIAPSRLITTNLINWLISMPQSNPSHGVSLNNFPSPGVRSRPTEIN